MNKLIVPAIIVASGMIVAAALRTGLHWTIQRR